MEPQRRPLRSSFIRSTRTGILTAGVLFGPDSPLLAQRARQADPLPAMEQAFDSLRYLRDQLDVTRSLGAGRSRHGVAVGQLSHDYDLLRATLVDWFAATRASAVAPANRRAFLAMQRVMRSTLGPDDGSSSVARSDSSCRSTKLEDQRWPAESLETRIFGCFAQAASRVIVANDSLDRPTILGLLGTTDDRDRRERLFRGLEPVWKAVNGPDDESSPYARLVRLRVRDWVRDAAGQSPMAARAIGLGLTGREVERWLERALESWRATLPDTLFEPWDYYHFAGAMSRRLADAVPRDSLVPITERFYQSLGADLPRLNVQYDLEPREGKYPIAFTTFGARSRTQNGQLVPAEPWIFASYPVGGVDNLAELLHESGHGIQIAAIRARPAFNDWPDSDPFTEGIADLAGFELYEPPWQQRFLGRAAPLDESIRAKYSGTMFDMAWALFEFRVHRPNAPSPNVVWTEITSRYFKIRPHPEWSWWAIRGQLIGSPGYMLNYALGAFLVADLRRELTRRLGQFTTGMPQWYARTSGWLYRFGAATPARTVTERFLGRRLTATALLADLARVRQRSPPVRRAAAAGRGSDHQPARRPEARRPFETP